MIMKWKWSNFLKLSSSFNMKRTVQKSYKHCAQCFQFIPRTCSYGKQNKLKSAKSLTNSQCARPNTKVFSISTNTCILAHGFILEGFTISISPCKTKVNNMYLRVYWDIKWYSVLCDEYNSSRLEILHKMMMLVDFDAHRMTILRYI